MIANLLAAVTALTLIIGIPLAGEYLGWPMEDVVGHLTLLAVFMGIGCGMVMFHLYKKPGDRVVWGYWMLMIGLLGEVALQMG